MAAGLRVVRLSAALVVAAVAASAAAWGAPAPQPAAPGRDPLVLPGFEPLSTDQAGIHLGAGRRYDWAGGLLPARIESRRARIAGPLQLVIRSAGAEAPIAVTGYAVREATGHRVEIRTTGTALDGLQIETRASVEYDGLGVVEVLLTPARPVPIDRVDLAIAIARQPDQQVLGFGPENAYWSGKEKFLPPCYRGVYRNILGFLSRETAFWWLADDVDGGVQGPAPVTEIRCGSEALELVQPVVAGPRVLREPLRYRFAFLATPVRDVPPEVRANRVVAVLSRDEARVGNLNLWWTDATSHFALPYLDYPTGARERITPAEIKAYPGVKRNRANLEDWREMGIERLPYMSFRAISPLDVQAQPHLGDWQAEPLRSTGLEVDAPYTTAFKRPLVSLRAAGFVDHQLERLGAIADGLGVRGFYFDQAEPIGSANPGHVPRSSTGNLRPATDVLAMRDFFKRLATLLYARGHPSLIYVHNSTAPIIPAYTFVTGMVQGEELNAGAVLKNLDYQAAVPMDYIGALYAAQHSGVPTVWLEELWSEVLAAQRPAPYRTDVRAWLDSREFYSAWRNFMALALLHDIPVWTQAPVMHREALYGQLDRFGVARSEFIGFWTVNPDWRRSPVLISAYFRPKNPALLAIVANMTAESQTLSPAAITGALGAANNSEALLPVLARYRVKGKAVVIPPRDFVLVELR